MHSLILDIGTACCWSTVAIRFSRSRLSGSDFMRSFLSASKSGLFDYKAATEKGGRVSGAPKQHRPTATQRAQEAAAGRGGPT